MREGCAAAQSPLPMRPVHGGRTARASLAALFAGMLLVMAGCAGTPGGKVGRPVRLVRHESVDSRFDLPMGDRVQVRKADLRVAFVGVPEDSRCPEGARCPQAGRAMIRLALTSTQAEETATLSLPGEALSWHGYRIELLDLEPRPRDGEILDARRYEATLRITRHGAPGGRAASP